MLQSSRKRNTGGLDMKKFKIFGSLLTLVIAGIILFTSISAHADNVRNKRYREALDKSEDTYERELRNDLTDMGFKNVGINITKSFDENKNITYKVVIHHHSFEYASKDRIEEINDLMYDKAFSYLDGNVNTEISY